MQLIQPVTRFPTTRYQGSKRKLVQAILDETADLPFDTVLDAFGGTGAVAYGFKCRGKQVTYNDMLAFNHVIGRGLIENSDVSLDRDDVESVLRRHEDEAYGDFITRTFEDIYYTAEENAWLDMVVANIKRIACPYKQSLAWFALIQAAIVKRPFNLFHRRNLYLRTADVKRSFGNKAMWDRSFEDHFRAFARQACDAVFDTGVTCRAVCSDALAIEPDFDLVYIDPPYVSARGIGVDYRDFYHFLEGLVRYEQWPDMVDWSSKHRRLVPKPDPWTNGTTSPEMFRRLFAHHRDSILVVSYRNDGIPTIPELVDMLSEVKSDVRVVENRRHQYVLSTRRDTHQALLIAQ